MMRFAGWRSLGENDLLTKLSTYLTPAQVEEVHRAYLFGAQAHEGQQRLSGEPYIAHPIAVASILAELHMDHRSILAAILHDVIEDTPTAKEQIAEQFGEEVAQLVDGVSKLTQIKFRDRAEAQAENFRKMVLAMTQDLRVILIKLADRLHNMRTLGVMPPPKRRRIARETLDIYAPIAHRLGMHMVRVELEDLCFQSMYPVRYKVLQRAVKRARGRQKEVLRRVSAALKKQLKAELIDAQVLAREKHLWSLYQKMRDKNLPFEEVMDVFGFRIVVERVDTCYRALGVVHGTYKPVPGRFKDYIAIPKSNGYQSLHTTMLGPQGLPLEIQIRTLDMDRVAESGIAAHWQYKEGSELANAPQLRAREWLKNLLEMQKGAGNSQEFLENVRVDLFPDEVYVFTPQGDIRRLPRGATAVDFAYAVHTDVGNTCVAAKIDRRLVPLRTQLVNGQTVEIITNTLARPNPQWLDFVVTAKARANVRNFLKLLQGDEAVLLGKRLLERALSDYQFSLDRVPPELLGETLQALRLGTLEELLERVGLGDRSAALVARRLVPAGEEGEASGARASGPLAIRGTEGMVVSFPGCCRPIPGDPILGFLSSGKGIVIHNENCPAVAEFRKQPDKWVQVQWDTEIDRTFPVEIRVDTANQRGVLATVASEIADLGSNIEKVQVNEHDDQTSTMLFLLAVRDRKHLAGIMRRIRSLPAVLRIQRTKG
ncbi:MAG: bifunctional GTP diphosphokinase/guanosine-3',5'-bis pyrophosphate 3'-pyrophosphohydrolase [Xanthomonadaceae bacterium]|nr:bifunctional GTP diphosphokinase/guanosine-3',5'-bis pyrophosphate 3'-pyrophosphohydrolase [Xanthomonadaceae bacterium]